MSAWFDYVTPHEASILREREALMDLRRSYNIEAQRIKMRCVKRAARGSKGAQKRFNLPVLDT
ncbi:MAG TPA: hypothetical protein VIU82_00330 [Bosea sp. (in: a-proteobacteria)]